MPLHNLMHAHINSAIFCNRRWIKTSSRRGTQLICSGVALKTVSLALFLKAHLFYNQSIYLRFYALLSTGQIFSCKIGYVLHILKVLFALISAATFRVYILYEPLEKKRLPWCYVQTACLTNLLGVRQKSLPKSSTECNSPPPTLFFFLQLLSLTNSFETRILEISTSE